MHPWRNVLILRFCICVGFRYSEPQPRRLVLDFVSHSIIIIPIYVLNSSSPHFEQSYRPGLPTQSQTPYLVSGSVETGPCSGSTAAGLPAISKLAQARSESSEFDPRRRISIAGSPYHSSSLLPIFSFFGPLASFRRDGTAQFSAMADQIDRHLL
ncbi:hypothetical protein FRB90_004600 [Tulasnella sp. 427]|nr:hypothetical protein FRB90_004600 [Tulasnella sp. 427]